MKTIEDALTAAITRHRKVARAASAVVRSGAGPDDRRRVAVARRAIQPVLHEVRRLGVSDEAVLEKEMREIGPLFSAHRELARLMNEYVYHAVADDVRSACEPAGIKVNSLVWAAVLLAALAAAFGRDWGEVEISVSRPWEAMLAERARLASRLSV